jgi:hypothetical protein
MSFFLPGSPTASRKQSSHIPYLSTCPHKGVDVGNLKRWEKAMAAKTSRAGERLMRVLPMLWLVSKLGISA